MLPSVLAMALCLVPQLTTRPHQLVAPTASFRLAAAPRAALTEADEYAPGPPLGTYRLRVPASRVGYVPEAQGGLPPGPRVLYVLGTRTSDGRTVAPRLWHPMASAVPSGCHLGRTVRTSDGHRVRWHRRRRRARPARDAPRAEGARDRPGLEAGAAPDQEVRRRRLRHPGPRGVRGLR